MVTLRSSCALLASLVSLQLAVAAGTGTNGACRRLQEAVKILETGTIEDVWNLYDELDDPEAESFASCREELLARLPRVIARRDDARISASVLDLIRFEDAAAIAPALRAGLSHPSPDVRRRAARAVAGSPAPELTAALEERFAIESDLGVRRDLMATLAQNGSRRFLDAFRALAASDDEASLRVARRAVMRLPDTDSVELLQRIAMDESEMCVDAVEALSRWDDIPAANLALRAIGRGGPESTARAAIRQFEARGDSGDDVDALIEIANARAADGDDALRDTALASVATLESRLNGRSEMFTFSCGGAYMPSPSLVSGNVDEFRQAVRYVASPDRHGTSRCWDAPGFMRLDAIAPRMPAGEEVSVADTFSWEGSRWFAVLSSGGTCWMPEDELVEEPLAVEIEPALEFDAPMDDAQSASARKLEKLGWLRWLGADEQLATLRLEADPSSRDVVAAIAEIRRGADAPSIARMIDRWLYAFAQAYSDDEELGKSIPDEDPRWSYDEPEEDEEP